MNVHQVLSGAGPRDAITTEARMFRARFRSWGWGGRDHAVRIAPGLDGAVAPLRRLSPAPDDVLLLHHSAYAPGVEDLLTLGNPKVLLYHNITPAEWLWDHAPIVAAHCAVGRAQLPALVRGVDVAAADSAFNAAELRAVGADETSVIPLLIERGRLGAPALADDTPAGPPTVLFVGRLSPHKRQDEAIRAFALYRRHRAPDARLTLVGDPLTLGYARRLRSLADELAPGAVRIETGLTAAELGDRYRSAAVFLCLSEHEGFCIPILEAMQFGLPVIARPSGAIPEVASDAALLTDDTDLAVVAELIHLAANDVALRAELQRRGARRLAAYAPDAVAERLRTVIERTASSGRDPAY